MNILTPFLTTENSESNDETPLLEDARESRDVFDNEETREIPDNLEQMSNSRTHSTNSNMVTRFLRSVQTMSRSFSRRSLSDYDDDEEPLIVRTSLRRQGAIRRSPVESSNNSSSRSSNSSFNSEPNEEEEEESSNFEIQNASEDELPLTSDDNSSLV